MSEIIRSYLARPIQLQRMDLPEYYFMLCSIRRSMANFTAVRYVTADEFRKELGI